MEAERIAGAALDVFTDEPNVPRALLESDRVSAGFYESAGWAPDGWARTLDTGGEPLREIRWHALLDNPDEAPQEGAQ